MLRDKLIVSQPFLRHLLHIERIRAIVLPTITNYTLFIPYNQYSTYTIYIPPKKIKIFTN